MHILRKTAHYAIVTPFTTLFYIGFLPYAPGTIASLATALLFALLHYFLKELLFSVIFLEWLLVTIIAIPICTYSEKKIFLKKDSSKIVIDEYSGMLLTLLPLLYLKWQNYFIIYYLIGFGVFRFFDISKTLGIDSLQNFKGGLGVILDDLLAGLYGAIIITAILFSQKLLEYFS